MFRWVTSPQTGFKAILTGCVGSVVLANIRSDLDPLRLRSRRPLLPEALGSGYLRLPEVAGLFKVGSEQHKYTKSARPLSGRSKGAAASRRPCDLQCLSHGVDTGRVVFLDKKILLQYSTLGMFVGRIHRGDNGHSTDTAL
jgi:hypothetical protein